MRLINWIKTSAFWLLLPSLAVAALAGMAVAGYSPLVFDPSLYEPEQAAAVELESVDAAAIEAEHAAETEPVDVELAESPAATSSGKLADGTWTGYAPCGKGNSDGWKAYYVGVEVRVSGGKVAGIEGIFGSSTDGRGSESLSWDASENQKYLDWAVSGHDGSTGVKAQLSGSEIASSVDTVSGATYSSAAIFNAYVDALGKSAAAAGSSVEGLETAVVPGTESAKEDGSGKVNSDIEVGKLADGSWTGYAQCGPDPDQSWKPYYVGVTLTVKGGKVASVDKVFGSSAGPKGSKKLEWDEGENGSYLDKAIDGVAAELKRAAAKGRMAEGVDTVSGATYSSEAIFEAYYAALAESAAAAGSTVEAPEDKEGGGKAKVDDSASEPEEVSADVEVGKLADGSWTGYAQCGPDPDQSWKPYYVGVTLTVKGGKVASVDKVFGSSTGQKGSKKLEWDEGENGQYLDGAIWGVGQQIDKAIGSGAPLASIDVVSSATFSSKAIFKAYYAALAESAAAAGSIVEVPDNPADDNSDGAADGSGESSGSGDGVGGADGSGDKSDGKYYGFALCSSSGSDSWSPYYLFVEVTAADGVVTDITDVYGDEEGIVDPAVKYSASENAVYLSWAVDGKFGGTGYRMKSVIVQIQAKITAGANVSGISTVSGATRSSRAILAAYEMAAENAANGVGSTPEKAVAATLADESGDESTDVPANTPADVPSGVLAGTTA